MPAAAQLVGRPAELDAFDGLLAALDDGSPAAVAIIGEPGIGKTRLLAELGERAMRADSRLSGGLEPKATCVLVVDACDAGTRSTTADS
jgi:DNA replication protein DnaC